MNIKKLIKTEIQNHTNLEYWGTEENIKMKIKYLTMYQTMIQ